MAASAAAPSKIFFIFTIPVTNVAATKPNNVTSVWLLCGNAAAPMLLNCHRAATKPFGSIA